jgi:hypothetical protein
MNVRIKVITDSEYQLQVSRAVAAAAVVVVVVVVVVAAAALVVASAAFDLVLVL